MSENLYAEHPEAYDALYAEKEYDGEVEFVVSRYESRGRTEGTRVLVVGCGTGEHGKRLVERGFDVTGVDKYEAMVERARSKSDATFRVGALPELPVSGTFNLVLVPFTVLNHLAPEDLAVSLRALSEALADGGVLVFDHTRTLPEMDGNPWFVTHSTEQGTYGRLGYVDHQGGRLYRWHSVVFAPDDRFFFDVHDLHSYEPAFFEGVLRSEGLSVETYADYDTNAEDGEEVFVAY